MTRATRIIGIALFLLLAGWFGRAGLEYAVMLAKGVVP